MSHDDEIFAMLSDEWSLEQEKLISKEAIIAQLEARVAALLVRQPEQFFQLMYRLDIAEDKVEAALTNQTNGMMNIALLIYERQLQKIISRKEHPTPPPEDADLTW